VFRVRGSGFGEREKCSVFSVQCSGKEKRVQCSGFRVQGSEFRVNAKSEKSKTAGACLMPTRFSKR
jgi:hypothetical protein